MPRHSTSRANCPICMDDLFNKLDDLDEPEHVVTPDCGHAFHRNCILEWFRMQGERYLVDARERRLERDPSPTIDDAPALCPTCREECLVDDETGQLCLRRLFLSFEDRGNDSSSQIGSSPVQTNFQPSADTAELLSIARRSKAVAEVVNGLDEPWADERTKDAQAQAKALLDAAYQAKAVKAVKTYVGGLTTAINKLHYRMKDASLYTAYRHSLNEARAQIGVLQEQAETMRESVIPEEIRKARADWVKEGNRQKKIQELAHERTRAELDKTKASFNAYKREVKDRWGEQLRISDQCRQDLEKAEATLQDTQARLEQRTVQLQAYKTKKARLQERIDALEAELAATQMAALSQATFYLPDEADTNNAVDETTAGLSPLASDTLDHGDLPRATHDNGDESLLVEMPSFEDSVEIVAGPSRQTDHASPVRPRAHPTARTFRFDSERGTSSGLGQKGSRKRSKYFADDHARSDSDGEAEERDGSSVLVDASSPVARAGQKRARVNPFATTAERSAARGKLPARQQTPIEIDSDSSPAAMRSANLNVPPAQPRAAGQKSMTNFLVDKSGRPHKSLATGPKAARRA